MRTLTQVENQTSITINATDFTDPMQQFISKYKAYTDGEPYIVQPGNQRAIKANKNVVGDREKIKQLQTVVKEFGGVFSAFPDPPKFLFPAAKSAAQGYKFTTLHEDDIEDGGPQPRLHILDDPIRLAKVNAIADSIEIEGQREPIDVYPSPSGNGKYRVCEGRMRHTAIFRILKPQGRKGPDGQIIDSIIAKVKNRTELEAYEDAWILQDKESLTAFEQGAYIDGLTKKFPEVYAPGKHGVSFQETIAKRLGFTQGKISQVLSVFNEARAQQENLPKAIYDNVINKPESVFREAKKTPESKKTDVYETIATKELRTSEVKELVHVVSEKPEMTKADIEAEAERIRKEREAKKAEAPQQPPQKTEEELATERVAAMAKQDEKYEKKLERSIDKVVENASHFPEDLMVAVHGHLSGDAKNGKVDAEKAEAYAKIAVERLFARATEEEVEKVFAEVDEILAVA